MHAFHSFSLLVMLSQTNTNVRMLTGPRNPQQTEHSAFLVQLTLRASISSTLPPNSAITGCAIDGAAVISVYLTAEIDL